MKIQKEEVCIFWFRRDLRLNDNAGLYYALKNNTNVLPVFIFDSEILDQLSNKEDRRVEFIHLALIDLQKKLNNYGSTLLVLNGNPVDQFKNLFDRYSVKKIFTNHDYEPSAIARDEKIYTLASNCKIEYLSFKDQVIFEKKEVTKEDGSPYTVFSPYMKKWKSTLNDYYLRSFPTETYFDNFLQTKSIAIPTLTDIGFKATGMKFDLPEINENIITRYKEQRDFPAIEGTTRLSVHLRFGTVSIRMLARKAIILNEQWLNELIWRDFYMMILFHFPRVVNESFKKQYDRIPWRNDEQQFEAWCNGKTGYPIVDAGMRELNTTGFMHNRVRMVVASFLVKHLLIDWRWGEAYFAEKLTDFDLSANNGGWQWAASSGCDAVPYFRVFSPDAQTTRFDPEFKYIRKWVPEFEQKNYPQPIVEHKFARERILATYKKTFSTKE